MCGIVGIAGYRSDELIRSMTTALEHRGPDGEGHYFSDQFSLGMRRLSIIDLEGGAQPMYAADDKVSLVFNGEIYNYQEIAAELKSKGHSFKTTSDTEVILNGYLEWGMKVVEKLNGMFCFAVSDQRDKPVLYLARDRVGVKPLYYHLQNGQLTFASELKALLLNPSIATELNPGAVHHYLQLRYVPGPDSLIQGIKKFPPATIGCFKDGHLTFERYWELPVVADKPTISYEDALDELTARMETAVKRRLVSDVPVGVYLSGGLDSALIAALMTRFSDGPVASYSIGFDSNQDETDLARATADILGCEHHELTCSDEDFGSLDDLLWSLDEPIGDAIVLPMYILARETAKSRKVVLAGEGADEVFGGYLFHKVLLIVNAYKDRLPAPVRRAFLKILEVVPHNLINLVFSYPAALGPAGKRKLLNFLQYIETDPAVSSHYRYLISLFHEEELFEGYSDKFSEQLMEHSYTLSTRELRGATTLDNLLSVQYNDWLPDDIMMKLDKIAMAHSLEAREPFLDHELIEFATSLPDSYKVRFWQDKRILRDMAKRVLPTKITKRQKKPFYIPLDRYMQNPTFQRLIAQFRDQNHLTEYFQAGWLDSYQMQKGDFLQSKQLFSLMLLDRWIDLFIRNKSAKSPYSSTSSLNTRARFQIS